MSGTVLAIRPGALGDTLLALPALRVLRARFAGARLHLVGHRGGGALLQAAGEIDGWTDFDAPELAGLFSPHDLPSGLERLGPIEAAVAWLADAEGVVQAHLRRLGAARVLVAPARPEPGLGRHTADHLLASLSPWGVAPPAAQPLVLPGPSGAGTDEQAELLVHPGSGSAAKNWPPESFARVLDQLGQARPGRVGLLCGPADEAACAAVLRHAAGPLPVVRPASVLELGQTLARARAYLGNDSGVSHLAAVLGVRTVALFGPTDPCTWAPRGPWVRVFSFSMSPTQVACALQEALRLQGEEESAQ
ncbi:MAG: glycosyltransferase family 9 protein [Chloroflexi bacterium]|nr:glycosyltransferase family 9 protein [Chloroflexota bacterium]